MAAATGLGTLTGAPAGELTASSIGEPVQIAFESATASQLQARARNINGSACKKRGSERTSQGVVYTCRKQGKKLVWVRKLTGQNVPSTPMEPVYQAPSTVGASAELCRIADASPERRQWNTQAAGFPTLERYVPHQGTVRMALIPIDWEDLPGDISFIQSATEQTRKLTQWYDDVSDGRLKVEWDIHPTWIRLPGNSNSYSVPYSGDKPATVEFFGKVIPAVDPAIDFTGVQVANFLLPSGQSIVREGAQDWPWEEFVARRTSEGALVSATAAGAYFEQGPREYWTYWAHEFGHVLQLAHVGSSRRWSSMHGYDLMGGQDGPTRELSGWMRFVAGWLPDDQIFCQDKPDLEPTSIMLNPLTERSPGVKAAIVRVSPTQAVIVESRRPSALRCSTINNPAYRSEGVLVYTYDATKGHNEEFLQAVRPDGGLSVGSGCWTEPEPNALLQSGESVTALGVTVSVTTGGPGNRYDVVRISAGE